VTALVDAMLTADAVAIIARVDPGIRALLGDAPRR
jgi:hypothetical protein